MWTLHFTALNAVSLFEQLLLMLWLSLSTLQFEEFLKSVTSDHRRKWLPEECEPVVPLSQLHRHSLSVDVVSRTPSFIRTVEFILHCSSMKSD